MARDTECGQSVCGRDQKLPGAGGICLGKLVARGTKCTCTDEILPAGASSCQNCTVKHTLYLSVLTVMKKNTPNCEGLLLNLFLMQ